MHFQSVVVLFQRRSGCWEKMRSRRKQEDLVDGLRELGPAASGAPGSSSSSRSEGEGERDNDVMSRLRVRISPTANEHFRGSDEYQDPWNNSHVIAIVYLVGTD